MTNNNFKKTQKKKEIKKKKEKHVVFFIAWPLVLVKCVKGLGLTCKVCDYGSGVTGVERRTDSGGGLGQ